MYGQNGCQAGRNLYVKIGADNHNKVEWMELYIDGYKVRREMSAPYEWGRPNGGGDNYLRNMRRGTYTLKCKIKTECGDIVWKQKQVTVHYGKITPKPIYKRQGGFWPLCRFWLFPCF